ncbi:hypothetical protein JKI95_08300 [Corynebacterium aquatimens]|nr:hypothetical protein [Corynebacterium aquatimens]QYH19210.1 hypothetical protein JKI95_08300 [Corynebacterium aquatimens]
MPGGGDSTGRGGGLAYTGANVLWALGIAALLIAAGIYLIRRGAGATT